MTALAYPRDELTGDYVRAGAGLAVMLAAIAGVDTAPAVTVVLAVAAAVFAAFALATAMAHRTRFEVDDDELRCFGVRRRAVRWCEMDRFRLAFYRCNSEPDDGWMMLTVAAGRQRIGVDSRLAGFPALAARAAQAARRNGVRIDPASAANLDALGIAVDGVEAVGAWR